MAGDYGKRAHLVIDNLNKTLNGKYLLAGKIGRARVVSALGTAVGLVFASVQEEPFPYVVLESMLAGVIPIASRVGGVPEMVQGTFAERLLYPRRQARALTECLDWILSLSK